MTQGHAQSPRRDGQHLLTLNGGSSSLKFALYALADDAETPLASGQVESVGRGPGVFVLRRGAAGVERRRVAAADHRAAAEILIDWLEREFGGTRLAALGHRVVHGGPRHREAQRVTAELLADLRRISPFDPEHLPAEIAVMEVFARRYAGVPQIACFDTAFHSDMPRVARLLPIPRRFADKGVVRYGFHGLSYSYLLEELGRVAGAAAARGRVVLAHLGSGASLAAVRDGACIDTSMGFTPAAGVPMSTRSGDLDPGLVLYLAREEGMDAQRFHHMVHRESGLLGVSGVSADVRDLLAREDEEVAAAEALALFCYQVKKWIGAFAAALGGVDQVVFSAGIGENCPAVRARVCAGLEFLGIALDASRNAVSAPLISSAASRVAVRVLRTDEERMIARSVRRLLGGAAGEERP